MSALVLAATAATLVAQPALKTDVELSLAAGFGELASFGGVGAFTVRRPAWEGGVARGSVALGVLLGYQLEDYGAYAWSFPGTELSGATHRFEGLLVVGHDLRLTAQGRVLIATQLFVGGAQTIRRGWLSNPEVGVSGSYSASGGALSSGVSVRVGLRLTERVWCVAGALVPFPYASAIMPWAIVTMGASVEL